MSIWEKALSIRTIVAALSLETDNDPVARRALQLAAQHEARLVLVHIIENIGDDATWKTIGTVSPLSALRQQADGRIRRMIGSDGQHDRVEIVVDAGAAHAIINDLAQRAGADLLVIGPGKPQTVRERFFGSTADRLVRLAPCPILVARNAIPVRYEKISVAVDFSAGSEAALRAAAELVQGASINLVHIVDIPLQFEQAMLKVGTSQAEIERYREERIKAARRQLGDFLEHQNHLSISVRTQVLGGTPAETLIALSRSGEADLLALGLQGRNAIARVLLGSVAQRVLQAAGCDVLAVGEASLP